MLNFLRTICSGASGSADAANAIVPALEILWKGMLGIFVVCALIFFTVKVLNKISAKKK